MRITAHGFKQEPNEELELRVTAASDGLVVQLYSVKTGKWVATLVSFTIGEAMIVHPDAYGACEGAGFEFPFPVGPRGRIQIKDD